MKAETAPYLQKRWQELADHPLVGEARGVGMVAALELVKNKKTRERFTDKGVGMLCREHCFRNGLIMRAVGDTMIISPPLVIDPSQIDELITLARKCSIRPPPPSWLESLSGLLPDCASALARLTGW